MADTAVQDKPAAPPSANGDNKAIAEQPKRPAPSLAIGNKGLTPTNLEELWRFSVIVEKSGLCPKNMGVDAIFISIQMGLEIGLSPMQAMQSTAVINGRPSIYGDAALGLIRASGLVRAYEECECDPATELLFRELCLTDDPKRKKDLRIELAKAQATLNTAADNFGVTVFSWRDGQEPQFGRFTVADAKQAKLWGKDGPWTQYPKRMLKWRARGFILRDHYGDVLKGLRTVEESSDEPLDVTHAPLPPEDKPLLSKLQERAAQVEATRTETLPPTKPAESVVETAPKTTETTVKKPTEPPEPTKIDAEEMKELERLAFPKHPSLNSWRKSVKEIYKVYNVANLTPEQATEERKRLAELPAMPS